MVRQCHVRLPNTFQSWNNIDELDPHSFSFIYVILGDLPDDRNEAVRSIWIDWYRYKFNQSNFSFNYKIPTYIFKFSHLCPFSYFTVFVLMFFFSFSKCFMNLIYVSSYSKTVTFYAKRIHCRHSHPLHSTPHKVHILKGYNQYGF